MNLEKLMQIIHDPNSTVKFPTRAEWEEEIKKDKKIHRGLAQINWIECWHSNKYMPTIGDWHCVFDEEECYDELYREFVFLLEKPDLSQSLDSLLKRLEILKTRN